MEKTAKKPIKHKKLKIFALVLVVALIVAVLGFLIWASDYYHAEDVALAVLSTENTYEVEGNLTILATSYDTDDDIGIIFYPGAKVEATAYLPILDKLRQNGITCVLVEMPLNMAIFDVDAADDVYETLPDIEVWYIMGHSMGGGMASSYASDNEDKVEGLILLGAYVYGDYPTEKSLTIYGTYNTSVAENIDYEDNIIVIEGGNHAQFGNYGKQDGDPDADITADEQQNIAVAAILEFIG